MQNAKTKTGVHSGPFNIGALQGVITKTLMKLALAILLTFSSVAFGQSSSSFFEQIPASGINNAPANGTIAEMEKINSNLEVHIEQITAAIEKLGAAIDQAAHQFTPGASNRVEQFEMEAFRTTAEGLRFAVDNGPKALGLYDQVVVKADRVSAMLGTRMAARQQAAKRLAAAREIPAHLVDIEISPAEASELRDWSIVSDETKYTLQGTKLHLDRLDQIMSGVAQDRAQLAADGASLRENIARMEMLQRVVRRLADDALEERRNQTHAQDVRREVQSFGKVARSYGALREKGEQAMKTRTVDQTVKQTITLEH